MTSEPLHLYYLPASFYSQKVVIALKEKQLAYTETVVNISPSETYSPWYLKINPRGQVPVLMVGDRPVAESEAIIDLIDSLPSPQGRLVPEVTTGQGKLVADWRQKLDKIRAQTITFGVVYNPELHTADLKYPPSFNRDFIIKMKQTMTSHLEALKTSHPELSDAIDHKLRSGLGEDDLQPDKVREVLQQAEVTFDQVEEQLRQIKAEHPSEFWLCGPQFSAADINLCVLIGRMYNNGYLSKYLDPSKRPTLVEYWTKAMEREAVGDTIRKARPGAAK